MKYFNRRNGEQSNASDARGGLLGNTTVRVVAGVGAFSVFALAAGAGQGFVAPVAASPQTAQMAQAFTQQASDTTSTSSSNPLDIVVGNALTVTADAKGEVQRNAFAVATNVSGQGQTEVGVPVGPSRMVNVTSFNSLNVDNGTMEYNINSSGEQVQNLLATGGQFQGKMPVEIVTKMTVDGKEVDVNSATKITGQVVVNWEFKNKTTTTETVTYADAAGQMVSEQVAVGVPFTVALKGTFSEGWTNLVAPWANSGFSPGQEITGGGSMGSNGLTLSMSGMADNAELPEMSGSFVPTSANGSITTGLGKVATAGEKVTGILNGEAVPLLVAVQGGLGKASGEIATLLDKKVNPILNLLSKLRLDPTGVNKLLDTVGQDLTTGSNILLGANAVVDEGAAQLAGALATATSPSSQAALDALIASLDDVDGKLGTAITVLTEVSTALPEVAAILGTKVPSAVGILLCPSGTGSTCTVGQILEADLTGKLASTCNAAYGSGSVASTYSGSVPAALTTAIANLNAGTSAQQQQGQQLQQLQNMLAAQATAFAAGGFPTQSECTTAAGTVQTSTNGVFESLGQIGNDLAELLPLLKTLDAGLEDVSKALKNIEAKMPAINRALDNPCSPMTISNIENCGLIQALTISANADAQASEQLDAAVIRLVNTLKVPIDELFRIANDLGRAALPLEEQINGLPGVINELANGPLGYFVNGVEDLASLATSLTDGASKIAATNKLVDEKFVAGEGFPYGAPATGEGTVTAATYSFTLAEPSTSSTSTAVVVGYSFLLLIAALGASIWLTRRSAA